MTNELKRVMCIDDDMDILEVAKICLETVGGYEVMTCSTPLEAVTTLKKFGPDIVLLDVMMPGMDGPSVLKAMREDEALRTIPVMFMTARVQPREVEQYMALGASTVIAKPFDPMMLATQVADIWTKAQGF